MKRNSHFARKIGAIWPRRVYRPQPSSIPCLLATGDSGDFVVTNPSTTRPAGLPGLLRALILVMLLALAVPAFAMADDAPATVQDPPAADATAPDTTGTVTPEPATYSETTPPAE